MPCSVCEDGAVEAVETSPLLAWFFGGHGAMLLSLLRLCLTRLNKLQDSMRDNFYIRHDSTQRGSELYIIITKIGQNDHSNPYIESTTVLSDS